MNARGLGVRWLVALGALLIAPGASRAQDAPTAPTAHEQPGSLELAIERGREVRRLEQDARAALARQDWIAAEPALRRLVELDARDFTHWYNLACVRSRLGDGPEAARLLVRAVETGFSDLATLERDPDLAAARDQPEYRALVTQWPRVLEARIDANLAALRERYGERYTTAKDPDRRLAYVSAFDEQSLARARDEINALYDWGLEHVFTDLAPDEPNAPNGGGRARDTDAWVTVILPTPEDFRTWQIARYGPAATGSFREIGGSYDHDLKQLVARDLGGTLRHEFFHVLHWRSCARLGQAHAVWVQEGLCSLVEDYDLVDGRLSPAPSWRTNVALRLARQNRLPPIEELARTSRERFTGASPLRQYALARTFFLYLWSRGTLGAWYTHYTDTHAIDPTGVRAIEATFAPDDLAQINRDYRAWVLRLPEVPEQSRPGMAALGFDVDPGAGDGPVIASMVPRSDGKRTGLIPGDVITALDGRPTRDIPELLRVLGDHDPGDRVEISYRRGRTHGTARITLIERADD